MLWGLESAYKELWFLKISVLLNLGTAPPGDSGREWLISQGTASAVPP